MHRWTRVLLRASCRPNCRLLSKSGAVKRAEAITDADDLKNANEQNTAMKAAKISLSSATMQAVTANAGYNAIKAVPTTKNGHPIADISLIKGEAVKEVEQKLD